MFPTSRNRFSKNLISFSATEHVFRRFISRSSVLLSEQAQPAATKPETTESPAVPQPKYKPPIILLRKDGERVLSIPSFFSLLISE